MVAYRPPGVCRTWVTTSLAERTSTARFATAPSGPPAGTRLDLFYVRERGRCVSLVELRGWEPRWEEPLAVPERVGRYHPAVRELRERGLTEISRGTWTD